MTLLFFLNELSHADPAAPHDVDGILRGLVATLRELQRKRRDFALISTSRLPGIEIAPGHTVARWGSNPRNRDPYRFLLSLQNRAPFKVAGSLEDDSLTEYAHRDRIAIGLGYAHAFDGLGISLPGSVEWHAHTIRLECIRLSEEDSGLITSHTFVDVRHASAPEHANRHGGWLSQVHQIQPVTGLSIWENRHSMFLLLRFLPRVADDLIRLNPIWVRPVQKRLQELDDAARAWRRPAPMPQWNSYVTPEGDTRKALCYFLDLDGVTRIFDWHARFTPGPGRIHFRWDTVTHQVIIAYIGRKLE